MYNRSISSWCINTKHCSRTWSDSPAMILPWMNRQQVFWSISLLQTHHVVCAMIENGAGSCSWSHTWSIRLSKIGKTDRLFRVGICNTTHTLSLSFSHSHSFFLSHSLSLFFGLSTTLTLLCCFRGKSSRSFWTIQINWPNFGRACSTRPGVLPWHPMTWTFTTALLRRERRGKSSWISAPWRLDWATINAWSWRESSKSKTSLPM